ncbi:hypothetical protein FDG2_1692 [Candidatus Protofrankia californiensis]|uniref:Uncharacterized protein n=1 Tax=Candidatus Protofrankia californiensis TaxID=1839754 RepID=A0A1C3NW74_9ACTN|nr:hypothetical protein FDG2_1692 [Candidatus Protofrankia californiensis]
MKLRLIGVRGDDQFVFSEDHPDVVAQVAPNGAFRIARTGTVAAHLGPQITPAAPGTRLYDVPGLAGKLAKADEIFNRPGGAPIWLTPDDLR